MANEEISKEKVILVEGRDEVNFIKALLRFLNIQDVQVIETGGKQKIKDELSSFTKRSGYLRVRSMAIIVDADTSMQGTFQSITNLIRKVGLPVPSNISEYQSSNGKRVGIYIMPGNSENGMLEDLCLKSVDYHPAMSCVENYVECLKSKLPEKPADATKDPKMSYFPKNLSKSKALAFLAALHEPFSSVGIAAEQGYWDFDHLSLQELKDFLQNL